MLLPPPPPPPQYKLIQAFESHVGPVYGLDCSPFNHNLFVSCSADGQVRVSNMLQTEPVITIDVGNDYLFDVKWSKVRPMVFAVASANGTLYVYDLNENIGAPVCKIRGGEPGGKAGCHCIITPRVVPDPQESLVLCCTLLLPWLCVLPLLCRRLRSQPNLTYADSWT